MQIRIRDTERVISEFDFRKLHENISPIEELTESRINDLGADVVYEGQQPTGATVYQYSWHSPNSVDKYYCQNLNGRNVNAKSQIHS